jgi:hypothetical protein
MGFAELGQMLHLVSPTGDLLCAISSPRPNAASTELAAKPTL